MTCPRIKLSKSQYIKGVQCPLALWYFKHRKELIPEIDAEKQAMFDTGHDVGDMAKQLFPQGKEITGKFYEFSKFVNDTQTEIAMGATTLFEAAACTQDGLYSRIDILNRHQEDSWDLIEVKSSTGVKPYHIDDMAVQRYTFEQAGFTINQCKLVYVNNQFVKHGPINPHEYFIIEDVSDQVAEKMANISEKVQRLMDVIVQNQEPDQAIGVQCDQPFECEFKHHCWKHIPDYSVYSLFKDDKLLELTKKNIIRVQDIPENFELTEKQKIDIYAYKKNELHIEKDNIRTFLDSLHYPLYFLDYETVSLAIPVYDNSSPYQQVPFQFSLHSQEYPGGPLQHIMFLHEEQEDPREKLVACLIENCGKHGSVLVYYKSFEVTRNKELAALFPEQAEALLAINERVVDLWVPFSERYLYAPAMNSSASIKQVLPAFVPAMSYADLDIKEGGAASRLYGDFVKGKLGASEKEKLMAGLRVYCEQDTLAMVKLLDVLQNYAPTTRVPEQINLF